MLAADERERSVPGPWLTVAGLSSGGASAYPDDKWFYQLYALKSYNHLNRSVPVTTTNLFGRTKNY